jgi:peptidoglycan/LPS O-acetylase OafA/YrhL
MSDEEIRGLEASAEEEDEDEDAGSPFDHPAFLPVLLVALACWFGYDGWYNESIESVRFNRYGFGFLMGAAACAALIEFTTIRFVLPALFVAYAGWLGGLALLGAPDSWYNDAPEAQMFNRYAALVFLALAPISALREALRRRKRTDPSR